MQSGHVNVPAQARRAKVERLQIEMHARRCLEPAGSGQMPHSIPETQGFDAAMPVYLLRAFASWRLCDKTRRRRGAQTQRTDQGASELADLLCAPNSFLHSDSPRTSQRWHGAPVGCGMKSRRDRAVACRCLVGHWIVADHATHRPREQSVPAT